MVEVVGVIAERVHRWTGSVAMVVYKRYGQGVRETRAGCVLRRAWSVQAEESIPWK